MDTTPGGPGGADDDLAERQAYIDDMARKRGYVLDYHKYMANADYKVLVAANNLVKEAYLKERSLDRGTKELLFIISLTVMRAEKDHIIAHMKVALDVGVTPAAILEAIEITLPEAGVVVFQEGLKAWQEAVGALPLEPSDDVQLAGDADDPPRA